MQPLPTLPAVEQHGRPVGQLRPLLVQTTSSSTPMRPPSDNAGAPSWHGSILPLFQQVDYGKGEPGVIIQLEGGTIGAHYCILNARARGFLKRHIHTAMTCHHGKVQISMDGRDMPAPSVWALIQFAYTDTLPVLGGLDGAGYKAMIRHLLIAAERYSMGRLWAICERVMCKSLDIETVAATLAMPDRHGFKKLSEACAKFMAFP
ncbi:Speckle-type POZ protein-like protein [Hordeum vulgare]|uniref:BTB/POZ and MATH domain-containing protein 3-like n=1 Tax=Hordeum vulgare subsp. vulgare TaxID=112509 RepID=UPI001D1A3C6E|nr:BTB/POZ and MATH domain-containing protein 3-like [Hordeum vulgare subsp. vulgare]KAE8792230.1 Speckle-type POZ protein-like protein [Hordeum vulgare]